MQINKLNLFKSTETLAIAILTKKVKARGIILSNFKLSQSYRNLYSVVLA